MTARRKLKARAQHLEPVLRVGKSGLSEAFVRSVDEELSRHELIKIKFAEFKEEKKALSAELSARTGSALIMQVGHVVVLYRARPQAAAKEELI
jgi:RNA-binding protein